MPNSNRLNNYEWPEEWRRKVIVYSICAGMTNTEMVEMLKFPLRTIQRIRKHLTDSIYAIEDVAVRKLQDRSKQRVRSVNFIKDMQKLVENDPSISIHQISRQLGQSYSTVRKCLNEDLRYKSYKMRTGQLLTENTKEKRVVKSKKLLDKLKHPQEQKLLWFFSDEKNFCQDQAHNKQNNRWLALSPEDVPVVMKTKFPAHIMVLGVVSSDGHVMPPYFFTEGLKVNQKVYQDVLTAVVKPWIEEVSAGRPYVFQQDSAPAHTARKTQKWMTDNFFDHITPAMWPPNSPDCNPLDYYVWGAVERITNKTACANKVELRSRICQAFQDLSPVVVKHACSSFRSRLEAVINAKGGFIE